MTAFRHNFPPEWTTPLKLHHQGARGQLIVGEAGRELPFAPQRIFIVQRVASGLVRGGHAHRQCSQFLICMSGVCRLTMDDGHESLAVTLEQPCCGLLIPPLHWVQFTLDSPSAQLLVLASHSYDPDDYIADYGEFQTLAKLNPCNLTQPAKQR